LETGKRARLRDEEEANSDDQIVLHEVGFRNAEFEIPKGQ